MKYKEKKEKLANFWPVSVCATVSNFFLKVLDSFWVYECVYITFAGCINVFKWHINDKICLRMEDISLTLKYSTAKNYFH